MLWSGLPYGSIKLGYPFRNERLCAEVLALSETSVVFKSKLIAADQTLSYPICSNSLLPHPCARSVLKKKEEDVFHHTVTANKVVIFMEWEE